MEKQYEAKEKNLKKQYFALLAQKKQENSYDSAEIVELFKKRQRDRQKIIELESTTQQIKKNNNSEQEDKIKKQKELNKLSSEVKRLNMQKEEVVSVSDKNISKLQKTLN